MQQYDRMFGNHIRIAHLYFIMAAMFGVLLRFFTLNDFSFNYKYVMHAHSHIALLGWVYLALTALLAKYFTSEKNRKQYQQLFRFTQVTLVGMLISFPLQGYALFSITFSTLFLLASYRFFWFFSKNTIHGLKKLHSFKCVHIALWYMVLSSLGPWALGAIMNTLGAQSVWYRLAIYFYLHFQYNGWMIFALVGILLFILEQKNIFFAQQSFKIFFLLLNLGVLFSFFLSTLWIADVPAILNVLGGVGAIFQVVAFILLIWLLHKNLKHTIFSGFQKLLLRILGLLLVIKISLQLLTAFPYYADLATTYLNFTIGYLHLTFLGVVSICLFLFFDFYGFLRISKSAFWIYFAGFLLSEGLILLKGVTAWQGWTIFSGHAELLAFSSILLPLSLITMLFQNLRS